MFSLCYRQFQNRRLQLFLSDQSFHLEIILERKSVVSFELLVLFFKIINEVKSILVLQ